jgi:membrane-associated phospholipid phosphatase
MWNDPVVVWLYPTIAAAWLGVHLAINGRTARLNLAALPTSTRYDAVIPFVPSAVVMYLSGFVLANVGYFIRYDSADVRWAAAGYLLQYVTSIVLYCSLPTRAPRLTLDGNRGASARTLDLYQRISKPFNAFPSMHVSLGAYSVCWVWAVAPSWPLELTMTVWWVAVTASTLLTRQHTLVDVAGGTVLGVGSYLAVTLVP